MAVRRTFRKWMIPGAVLLLLIAAILAGASVYLSSDAFKERLLDEINGQIAGKITLDSLDLSLLPGSLELHQIRLAAADDRPLASVAYARIRFNWLPLIKRHIHISGFEIKMAETDLVYDARDRLTLVQALSRPGALEEDRPEDTGAFAWRLSVDDIDIQVSRIGFQRPSAQISGQASDIEMHGDVDLQRRTGSLQINVGQVVAQTAGRAHTLHDATARIAYDAGLAHPVSLDFQTGRSRVRLSAAPGREDPLQDLDAVLEYHLDLDDIEPWLPLDRPFAGELRGQVHVRGDLFDPEVSLNLDMDQSTLAGIHLQHLKIRLGLNDRLLTIETAESQSTWGHLALDGQIDLKPVFPHDLRRAGAGLEAPAYDLTLKTGSLRPQDLPLVDLPVHGTWQGEASFQGKGFWGAAAAGQGELEFKGDIEPAVDSQQALQPIGSEIIARFGWQEQRIDLHRIQADVGPDMLKASGHLDLGTGQVGGRGKLSFQNLAKLKPFTGVELPSGQGELAFEAAGSLRQPEVQGTLLARELAYQSWFFGQVALKAALDKAGTLRIFDLMLENQGTLISGGAELSLLQQPAGELRPDPPVTARLDFENLQLSDFGLLDALKGHLNGGLQVSGSLGAPRAELTLAQSPLGWQDVDGMAEGSAQWQNGRLQIDALHLSKGTSSLELSGGLAWLDEQSGQWSAVPVLDLRAVSRGLELADVHPQFKGRVVLQATVQGPAQKPQGRFELQAQDVDSGVQKFKTVELKGRLEDQILYADQVQIALAPGQVFQGQGWYAFDQRFGLSFSGESIDLRHIGALQQADPVDGRLSATLEGSGSVSRPQITLFMSVADPHFNDQSFEDFNGELTLQGREFSVQADLNFDVQARGRVDSGAFDIQADFERTDLSPYLAVLMGPLWSGRLTGGLQATGNWHAIEQTAGHLVIDHVELTHDHRLLISADGLSARVENSVLNMPPGRFVLLQNGYLELSASGHLQQDLQARMDGRLPLAALAPFIDALSEVEGAVTFQGSTRGPLSDLQWQADLTLADVGFVLPETLQGIEQVSGTLRIQPDALSVQGLSGVLDSGRFQLDGRIQLQDRVPTAGRLDLKLQALPLQWPETMEAVISGGLTLQGSTEGATLSGDLVLVEGLYYKDVRFNLLSGFTQTRRAQQVPTVRRKPDWMKRIALEIDLGYRNPFLVDNNLARLVVVPDLHLGGTLADPVMSGRAEVTEGEVIYGRKTFTVKRGVIDFVNPNRIEPTLDILGEVRFRKWLITLGISGTPDRLAFSLDSDPPESDSDILSLLLLGRTNAEIAQGEGGGQQTTEQMLAQLLATTYGEDIKRRTGVDIFEVGSGSEENVDDPGALQVTVGKRLSRRLTVKYGVEFQEGETIQRAISEYRFLEHLLASGFQDSSGKYGGELLFRMDFR